MTSDPPLKLGLPKGRMEQGVFRLLADAGIHVSAPQRGYRPQVSLPGFDVKILKPQNIVEMLHIGSRDLGFTGADWVSEMQTNPVELLDTKLDPVNLVAAAPPEILKNGGLNNRKLVIASECERLTTNWIKQKNWDAMFVRSYGATEVFPPEDADCIVDITATGETLRINRLQPFETLLTSSTRLYANSRFLDNPANRNRCEEFVLLLQSVLDARHRVMVEVNVCSEKLEQVINVLPCMRQPTIAPLNGDDGYAVKAAVPRDQLPQVILRIKAAGGTDIVVSALQQIVS
jgi:ATP phosphoribosyltransferase